MGMVDVAAFAATVAGAPFSGLRHVRTMSFDVNAEAKRMMMREGDMESFLSVGEALAADTAGS
jgi:hypothetical protein